jgi:hypothetical protein
MSRTSVRQSSAVRELIAFRAAREARCETGIHATQPSQTPMTAIDLSKAKYGLNE